MPVFGTVARDGHRFYCWTEVNLAADHGVRFLAAFNSELGEDLVVMIDQTISVYDNDVLKSVSGEEATELLGETSIERVWNMTSEAR